MTDSIKTYELNVTIQDNGIIRDPFGWIVGRCDDGWFDMVVRHSCKPNGLTVSEDGNLLNWKGENYIRQQVDYLCDMCANDCDERKVIRVGQGAYSVCERWREADDDR